MADTPRNLARPTPPPPEFDDLDDTWTSRRKQHMGLDYLITTQAMLVQAHHERTGSERVIKALLVSSLAVVLAVAAGVIAMKVDLGALTARVDELGKLVERWHP